MKPRIFLHRVARRLLWELDERDFFNRAQLTASKLRQAGAKIGPCGFAAFPLDIDGPVHLLEAGQWVGWGEDIIVLTRDLTPVPYLGLRREAPVRLVEFVDVGQGSILTAGVTIGPRAVVSGGTVVLEDVPPDCIAIGNPARSSPVYRRWYLSRLQDIRARPHLYTEQAVFTREAPPWPDAPREGIHITRDLEKGPDMSGVRRRLRRLLDWAAEQLRETDEQVLSDERIRILRKAGTRVGEGCHVADSAWIDPRPGMVEIGNSCIIGKRVIIFAHDGFAQEFTGFVRVAPVKILDGCVLEPGVIVQPGVTIGPGSIVRAGALVNRDVPPYTVVAGSPAKPVMSTQAYIRQLEADRQAHPERYLPDARAGRFSLPPEEPAAAPNSHEAPPSETAPSRS